jgi:ATP-dependent Clp protease protease subunit
MARKDDQPKEHEGLGLKLLGMRTIMISGEINQKVAERTIAQLLVLDGESNDPIRIFLASQGGHVESGFAIYDVMRFVKSEVHVVGAGWVASIAVPIMMGAKKENRLSLPNTRYLIHQPWVGGGGGPASDISIIATELLKLRDRLNQLIADETGQDLKKVTKDSDRDYWMTAEEAVEYGIVTKIISNAGELG